jgi:hypothetical protein
MTSKGRDFLKSLEGHQVNVALQDGSRVDGYQLVSVGRSRVRTLWLVRDELDTFVALDEVVAVHPSHSEIPEEA